MTTKEYDGATIELDAEGYLTSLEQWTPELANELAAEVGLTLTDRHWLAINYVQADYREMKASPGLRRISANSGVPMKELYQLFPKGPGKLVAKIAGCPKPKSCL